MVAYTLRRLAAGVVLIFVVSAATHAMLFSDSENIARKLVGPTAPPEIVARKEVELGLDQPWLEQYWHWLTSFVRGDLGRSWVSGQKVSEGIWDRLPVTISLVVATVLVTAVVGTTLGVVAARRRGRVDAAIQVISVLGLAIPGFLIALWLVLVFAVQLGWFRATGYTPMSESFSGWVRSVTLPVVALSLSSVAAIAQQIRGSIVDELGRDYVRTLRSRGLPMNRVLYRHVLRNAAGPALAILGLQFIVLFGGAVFIEQIFALPGIGQLTITSSLASDIPVVMGLVVMTAVLVVVVNLFVDLALAALNPKARQ